MALCMHNGTAHKEPRFFSLYGPGDFSGTMKGVNFHYALAGKGNRCIEPV